MERRGCYTTARVTGGRVERLERHAARLRRDAARLGLPLPERVAIERLADATARAELAGRDGILRLEWSRAAGDGRPAERGAGLAVARGDASPTLVASTRPLGPDPATWRAVSSGTIHPGPGPHRGSKAVDLPAYDEARREALAAEVDEALLFDGAGRLVEGGRTNLVVVTSDGFRLTPARGLGPVEGLGLEIVREAVPRIVETLALDRRDLARAAELVAINAVRGAAAIVELDGHPVGGGACGPLAMRLRGLFGRR